MDSGPGETFRKYVPDGPRESTQLEMEIDFNKAFDETAGLHRPMLLLYGTLVGDCEAAGHGPGEDDVRIALRYVRDEDLRRLIRKLANAAWKAGALTIQQASIIAKQAPK